MSAGAAALLEAPRRRSLQWGRTFVSPVFDTMVIGGGLSLLLLAWMTFSGAHVPSLFGAAVIAVFLNSPHFAASTVRLYTKPHAFRDLPFVTMVLPLLMLALLLAGLLWPNAFGRHLVALYFTWSPYHYAAQAYGLAVMYAYRSGVPLAARDRRWLRVACLLPFVYAFLDARGAAIEWFLPPAILDAPLAVELRVLAIVFLRPACFLVPALLFLAGLLGRGPALPVISFLAVITNAYWWTTLRYMDAFVWATIFHSVQYLGIVLIFHVRERRERGRAAGTGDAGWWKPAAAFYAVCMAAGYLLFQAWPHAAALAGFSFAESMLIIVAIINIHHFTVDAFIWKLRRDPNQAVVTAASPGAPSPAAALVPA